MAIIDLFRRAPTQAPAAAPVSVTPLVTGSHSTLEPGGLMADWSIEVMPRTAAKIDSFGAILPPKTVVYIAHIEGTPIAEMVATARRLAAEGFAVVPHFPARLIADRTMLADWIARYQGEADVRRALLLGGGLATPQGEFQSSIQLIETGLFDRAGFTHLHVAGHPEGNRDIDRDGSTRIIDDALMWKVEYATRTEAQVAITTQFAFDPQVIGAWAERIQAMGCTLPIHVGIAGPAKLQTLIRFAISCGIGPSLKVLQRRALDVGRLLMPYEPTEVIAGLASHCAGRPDSLIRKIHLFPLGGIRQATEWMAAQAGLQTRPG